ncbi:MAG: DUF547 domain-containing protein [Elainella sp. Prado103]|jgi:hypothetical protein|nr:DUF547 domain-containing protein [Elainella sp. Prado103]
MLKQMPWILSGAIALLAGCVNPSPPVQNQDQLSQTEIGSVAAFSDEAYATVLRTYVNADGLVDYSTLQSNPQGLKDFVGKLAAVSPATYAAWSENEKIAFLVNAYNAITLESIVDQDPLKGSIKDIFGVWNFKRHRVMGRSLTLDMIEHEILRKDFQEPRIHAALVCAAISCPPLRQEPYTGDRLNEQLDDQVRRWLSGAHGLKIDRAENRVSISAIFKWFGEDWQNAYRTDNQFTEITENEKERAVLNFISNYVSPEDKAYLIQESYKLDYLNYDWSLNQQ